MMSPRRNVLVAAGFAATLITLSCAEPTANVTAVEMEPLRTVATHSLLECPTTVSVSNDGVVGLLGGVLRTAGLRVDVPLGAVPLLQGFDLRVPASQYMEVSVSAKGLLHYVFRAPVTVTIDYSRCSDEVLARGPLTVYWIDETSKALLENVGGIDDRANRKITFKTDHFSGYAIAN